MTKQTPMTTTKKPAAAQNPMEKLQAQLEEREKFQAMSKEDRILYVAEKNLKTYGSLEVPRQVQLQAEVKTCGRCGKTGPVMAKFGVFLDKKNGRVYANSWCTECRSEAGRTRTNPRPIAARAFSREMIAAMTADQRKIYFKLFADVAAQVASSEPTEE